MDTISGMAGRAEFLEALERELARHAQEQTPLAVLLVNIRGFRNINTLHGYATADRLLQLLGDHIAETKREQDIAGRVGVDEFALTLTRLKSPHLAELAANKLIGRLEGVMSIGDRSVDVRVNIGIAIFPEHGDSGESLLQQADAAIRSARHNHQYYLTADESMRADISQDILTSDLEHAVEKGTFELYYQPKVELGARRLYGAEALIRWDHPTRGFVSPEAFIPLAEDNGMIFPLTLWSLNTALRQSVDIRRVWPGFQIAVNLSAQTLVEGELVELVTRALRTWNTPPGALTVEVTESAVMRNPEASIETLCGLRELGVQLSIDDFGTGYSSFSYLKRLPVHELKIDKSFVQGLVTDPDDGRIVQTMINLGENFELSVIAEGIEDEQTMNQLMNMGCNRGQGFHFGRPMPREYIMHWVARSEWALGSPTVPLGTGRIA